MCVPQFYLFYDVHSGIPIHNPKGFETNDLSAFLKKQNRWFRLIVMRVRDYLVVKKWPQRFPNFDAAKEVELVYQAIITIQAASRLSYAFFFLLHYRYSPLIIHV